MLFLLAGYSIAEGQNILTVDETVNIALKNNFGILVARNDADIAKANNTPGNAGMLPSLQVTGSGSYAVDNVRQTLSAGSENKYPSQIASSVKSGTIECVRATLSVSTGIIWTPQFSRA